MGLVDGGYLSQPMVLMRDVQIVLAVLNRRRRESMELATEIRNAMSKSSVPGVVPPPPPKELLDG